LIIFEVYLIKPLINMPNSRTLNLILIVIGGVAAIYAEPGEGQNTYILLAGVMLLMIGLYRLSKGISSKKYDNDSNFVKEEEE
jgi:hypothetical protein